MKHYLTVIIFLVIFLGIFTTAYAGVADSPKIRVINVRTNYYGTIYLNGVSTGTFLNHSSANFAQPGTYTIVCDNPRISFTPSEFYWDATSTHSLYFEGIAHPAPATNPIPSNGETITLPAGTSATNVTLGWQGNVMNGGYKVYWNGAVDPVLVPDYNISNNHSWTTTALEAGYYTWKIVPYTNDPPDPNGGTVKGDGNDAKGDCTDAVEWSFIIEEEVVWNYPAGIATPIEGNPNLIITPSININNGGFSEGLTNYIFSSLELDQENPPEFLYGSMLIGEMSGIADFTVALNQPGRLYAVYLNEDMSWSRATPYMINVLDTEPIVPQSWLFDDVNFFQVGKQGIGWGITVVVISSADILPFDFPLGTDTPPVTYNDISINPSENLNLDFSVDEDHSLITGIANFAGLGVKKVVGLKNGGNNVNIQVTAPAGSWYGSMYWGGGWHQSSPVHIGVGDGSRIFSFSGVDFAAKAGEVIILLNDGDSPTLPVELSSFNAVLTAQKYVKLNWISESETNMLGYRIYRSDSADQAGALMITPTMIDATNSSSTANYSHEDKEVCSGSTYYYWLEGIDMMESQFFGPCQIMVQGDNIPPLDDIQITKMGNAYPNPFKNGTQVNINVQVKAGDSGQVKIYNIHGQAVKTINVKEGFNSLSWDGRDSHGRICGSGVYYYKLSTATVNKTMKMVFIK